jgi:hypothetical protein
MSEPWSEDVIDQVCLAIERDPDWLACYRELVGTHGKRAVNPTIGRVTLQLTGLRNLGLRRKAMSSLIKTYTLLG